MNPNFSKNSDGLIPAVVQDSDSGRVVMLGYMNAESFAQTQKTGKVTFYSRSRQSVWTKGETSGNFLNVVRMELDCDGDAILIQARPDGPTCHRGTVSCFDPFLSELDAIIVSRMEKKPEGSYLSKLLSEGLDRVTQKVGEEAVELVIASKNSDRSEFLGEAADLLFHLMVLLRAKGESLDAVVEVLRTRHTQRSAVEKK